MSTTQDSTAAALAEPENETFFYVADAVIFAQPAPGTPGPAHVLLIERGWDPYEGHWALPGGHVNPREKGINASVRELAEETGIHLDPEQMRYVGIYDDPDRDPRGRYISAAFATLLPEPTQPAAGDDAKNARWWPLDDLPPLAFDHEQILADALAVPAWY